jgi:hypothetical protein
MMCVEPMSSACSGAIPVRFWLLCVSLIAGALVSILYEVVRGE